MPAGSNSVWPEQMEGGEDAGPPSTATAPVEVIADIKPQVEEGGVVQSVPTSQNEPLPPLKNTGITPAPPAAPRPAASASILRSAGTTPSSSIRRQNTGVSFHSELEVPGGEGEDGAPEHDPISTGRWLQEGTEAVAPEHPPPSLPSGSEVSPADEPAGPLRAAGLPPQRTASGVNVEVAEGVRVLKTLKSLGMGATRLAGPSQKHFNMVPLRDPEHGQKPPPPPPPEKPTFKKALLNPRSRHLRHWDIYVGGLLLYTATVTPFEVSFLTVSVNAMFFINRLVDISFVMDMAVQLMLPTQTPEGDWVTHRRQIARNYLRSWFAIDLISVIPYDVLGLITGADDANNLKVLRVVRLMRLVKMARLLRAGRMFQRWEATMTINYSRLELIRFFFILLAMAHWIACGFQMVASAVTCDRDANEGAWAGKGCGTDEGFEGWVDKYFDNVHIANPSIWERYCAAAYWSVATLSTIGYGDVVPYSNVERVYTVFSAMIGATTYAFLVGSICSVVQGMDREKNAFYALMDGLNDFMGEKRVPYDLRVKLRDFFRFRRLQRGPADFDNIFVRMSPTLRAEVSQHLNSRWINSVQCFRGCSDDFVVSISMILAQTTYGSNEMVIQSGMKALIMYIIDKGLVVLSDTGRIVSSGGTFGEDMIFRSTSTFFRNYTATTLTNTVLLALSKERLLQVLEDFPDEKRKMRSWVVRMVFRSTIVDYARAVNKLDKMSKPTLKPGNSITGRGGYEFKSPPKKAGRKKLRFKERLSESFSLLRRAGSKDVSAELASPKVSGTASPPSKPKGEGIVRGASADLGDKVAGGGGDGSWSDDGLDVDAMPTREEIRPRDSRIAGLSNRNLKDLDPSLISVIYYKKTDLKNLDHAGIQEYTELVMAILVIQKRVRRWRASKAAKKRLKREKIIEHGQARLAVLLRRLSLEDDIMPLFIKHKVAFDSLDRIDITMLMAMGIPWGDADVILHTYNRLVHQSRENFDGGAAAGVANANNLKAAAPRNSMTKRGMSMVVR